jgi:hypothetical protein
MIFGGCVELLVDQMVVELDFPKEMAVVGGCWLCWLLVAVVDGRRVLSTTGTKQIFIDISDVYKTCVVYTAQTLNSTHYRLRCSVTYCMHVDDYVEPVLMTPPSKVVVFSVCDAIFIC